MESVVTSPTACPPWAFLPTDLLFHISGRLHDARDFIRFNAVCRPWRDAAGPLPARHHKFRPWLVSQHPDRCKVMHSPVFYTGVVSPKAASSTHCIYGGNVLPGTSAFDTTAWVAGPDGSSLQRFTVHPQPTLKDLVTGAVTRLPPFPEDNRGIVRWMGTPHGVTYGDGTIFLYSLLVKQIPGISLYMSVFTAAVMHPGDTTWTVMQKKRVDRVSWPNNCAAYHDGKVLVWMGKDSWCILTPDSAADAGDIDSFRLETTIDTPKDKRYMRTNNYVFESRGELMWASVLLEYEWFGKNTRASWTSDSMVPALAVMVHALEEEEEGADDGNAKMRWVERDGRSLGDRVLFLGFPTSFAADATQEGMDGGCAYFVSHHVLFRYNLIECEIKRVELPHIEWISPDAHMWLRPQPVVAPIQGIQEILSLHPYNNKPK